MNNKNDNKPSLVSSTKEGNKIKIALPSLCSYDDEEDEDEKELAKSNLKNLNPTPIPANQSGFKRSGLLSMLPPPKSKSNPFLKNETPASNTTAASTLSKETSAPNKSVSTSDASKLIPRTIQKPAAAQIPTVKAPAPKVPAAITSLVNVYGYDDDEDEDDDEDYSAAKKLKTVDDEDTDYFSTKQNNEKFEIQPTTSKKKCFEEDDEEKQDETEENLEQDDEEEDENDNNPDDDPEPQFDYGGQDEQNTHQIIGNPSYGKLELDKDALQKLGGRKGMKMPEGIQITDVSARDIVGDNKSELMKQITNEYKPSANKDYFGSGSRRTHHISYLAHVARERDQELKNAWAQSKFNKQQARQKYGF